MSKPAPVAWLYKGDPDFNGDRWRENWCVTLNHALAMWKAAPDEPIPLFRAEAGE